MMQALDGGPKSLAPADIGSVTRLVWEYGRIVGGRGSFLRHLQAEVRPLSQTSIFQH